MYTNSLIILAIGFALAYIAFQLIPLIMFIANFDKSWCKEMKADEWAFLPIFVIMFLCPVFGAVIGYMFICPDSKAIKWLSTIAIYLVIIGTIMLVKSQI